MRLFVAVWPPPPVVEVLAALERPEVAGVRWTGASHWHVTLRFLGDVADESVAALVGSLRAAAVGLSPAEVVLGDRLAAFGPSVLYVPVDGLAPWAHAVGGAEGEGPFVGHVTVARGRRGRGSSRGDVRPLVGLGLPVAGERGWTASSFTLVRSDLGHGGARYSTVATVEVGDHPHTNVRSQLR